MSTDDVVPERAQGMASRCRRKRAALAVFDEAIARNPENAVLRERRAALARELAGLADATDLPGLRVRLAQIEARMAAPGNQQDAARMVEARSQVQSDIEELERWGAP
jgi:hypothetical protein